jgi:WD40 repeat protein
MKSIFFIFLWFLSDLSHCRKFSAEDNHLLLRVSDPCISPDGKDVFSTIRIWDKKTGKISSYITKTNIESKKTFNVTKLELGVKDGTPLANNAF